MDWTSENVEKLRKLWANDLSGSAIAAELKTTRSAVIAKAARLGLPGRTPSTNQRAARSDDRKKRKQHPWRPASARAPDTHQPITPSDDAPVSGVTLLDIESHQCRWPLGDPQSDNFRFCGCRKVDGRPYCEAHLQMAYVPVRPRVNVRPSFKQRAA